MDKASQEIKKYKEHWEAVKNFYVEKFGIDPELVDLNSNYSILVMCASGASNSSISKFLDIPEGSVELVLNEVFSFTGWTADLPFNPYKLYLQSEGDSDKMAKQLPSYSISLYLVYKMCETMERIDARLKNEWV